MLTEDEKRVWRGLLNAEKHARYYSFKSTLFTVVDGVISFLVLSASSGAILSLLEQNLQWLSPWLLAFIAFLTILSVVVRFAKQAAMAHFMKNECRDLAIKWERIWIKPDLAGFEQEADFLEERLESVTNSDPITFNSLNDKYNMESINVLKERLGPVS